MCARIRETVERLDWLRLVEFQSFRDPAVVAGAGVPVERLAARMHARYVDTGAVVSGAAAMTAMVARVPVLTPLWPVLALTTRLGLAELVYAFVADRRRLVPVGACTEVACRLPAADAASDSSPRAWGPAA
jgi:hypothetical protein